MRTRTALVSLAALSTGLVITADATPASAAVSATTSGTVVTVSVTSDSTIDFSCVGSTFRVNGANPAPSISCATVTSVWINGTPYNITVDGSDLNAAAFTANPNLVVSPGAGEATVTESDRPDQMDLGAGSDTLILTTEGSENAQAAVGSGFEDRVVFRGSTGNDTISATSAGSPLTINVTGAVTTSRQVSGGAEHLEIYGEAGNDTLNTTGVTTASFIVDIQLHGGAGNDTITDGARDSTLFGEAGTNTLIGGAGQDDFWSSSETDTINASSDSAYDAVHDADGLRSGGRTFLNVQSQDLWNLHANTGDATTRVRPGGSGTLVTTSLTRTGQQLIPTAMGSIQLDLAASQGEIPHRAIVDVVMGPKSVVANLPTTLDSIIDITVPTGSYTKDFTNTTLSVVASGFAPVVATNVADYSLHGPWTNKDQGFIHRVTRDLMFRFIPEGARNQLAHKLTVSTLTRPEYIASIMNTDEYRGLDVDRVFSQFLRRGADPGGRTYWVDSIAAGKALWRFRAQLLGSSEYFTKAGGTNAAWVDKAYADVLGRAPDPGGRTYWTNKLNNGVGRGSVALQFINSPEEKRSLINEQFLRFLDRTATTTELNTWVPTLTGNTGEQTLIAFLAATSAYYDRT